MAKRFTDTNKWDHAWFRKLTPAMKCAWIYLCDKCDHAGIWTADFESLSFHVGEEIETEQVLRSFGDKINQISSDKFLLQSFIDFQYGKLNPENRVHQSVLSKLEKEGANKGLTRTLQGPKDKDKDKDKEKDKEKDKDKDKEICAKIEIIYQTHYPLKKGKSDGLKAARRDIKTDQDVLDFETAVVRYANDCRAKGTDPKYIKHFSTFVSTWRDWLDPDAGKATVTPIRATKANQVQSNLANLWQECLIEEGAK